MMAYYVEVLVHMVFSNAQHGCALVHVHIHTHNHRELVFAIINSRKDVISTLPFDLMRLYN
jgi:hypothetical protein